MNKKIIKIIMVFVFVFSGSAFGGSKEKKYDLPNHGVLLLNVPDAWVDQVRYPPGGLPPTIHFSKSSGERFEILLTPMWKMPGAPSGFGTKESVRQLVSGSAHNASSQAVEKNIVVKQIEGPNVGYYFTATDKAPPPGEYKYMSQGAFVVSELMGTFTILTSNPNSEVIGQAISMLGKSKHLK